MPIEPRSTKSILEMAHGAILERVDYEMAKILDNILDANTEATAKRRMTLTLTFAPDGERATVAVSATAKTTLAPHESGGYVFVPHRTGRQGSGCGDGTTDSWTDQLGPRRAGDA